MNKQEKELEISRLSKKRQKLFNKMNEYDNMIIELKTTPSSEQIDELTNLGLDPYEWFRFTIYECSNCKKLVYYSLSDVTCFHIIKNDGANGYYCDKSTKTSGKCGKLLYNGGNQ